jgi:hypothetical protein
MLSQQHVHSNSNVGTSPRCDAHALHGASRHQAELDQVFPKVSALKKSVNMPSCFGLVILAMPGAEKRGTYEHALLCLLQRLKGCSTVALLLFERFLELLDLHRLYPKLSLRVVELSSQLSFDTMHPLL